MTGSYGMQCSGLADEGDDGDLKGDGVAVEVGCCRWLLSPVFAAGFGQSMLSCTDIVYL
jgi:hypothetical protein